MMWSLWSLMKVPKTSTVYTSFIIEWSDLDWNAKGLGLSSVLNL